MRTVLAIAMALILSMGPLAPATGMAPEEINTSPDGPVPLEGDASTVPTPAGISSLAIDGHFIENLGQMGEGIAFYCVGEPLSVAMGTGGMSYLHLPGGDEERGVMVSVEFEASNSISPVGRDPLSHPTNYLMGDDPDQWVVDARSYRQVVYEDLWDGIDLWYRFERGMLKYEFLVEPYADVSQIVMRYLGQDQLMVEPTSGNLVIRTPVVDLIDQAPVSYQGTGAAGTNILSSFSFSHGNRVGFHVDGYDPSRTLVIDPGLSFSTFLGGSHLDGSYPCIDELGNVLLAGWTNSTDFPTTPGVIQADDLRGRDGFVCKLSLDGTQLLFSTYIGTDEFDACLDLLVDRNGEIIVTGQTQGPDFPTTSGAYQTEPMGVSSGFLTRFNENCSEILSSTLMGGSVFSFTNDIHLMSNGDIMVLGFTWDDDFPVVSGCYDLAHNGDLDAFLARFDNNLSTLVRSTFIGGVNQEYAGEATELIVDGQDDVYMSIQTASHDYPITANAIEKAQRGCHDAVVTKLDGNLTKLYYSTFIGGSDHDSPESMTVDPEGALFLIGTTSSSDYPITPGAWQDERADKDAFDAFITKISPDGSSIEFSTFFGGEGYDAGSDIALGPDGLVYFSIYTESKRHPITEYAYDTALSGESEVYMGVFDDVNQTIRYGSYFGGTGKELWWPKICLHNSSVILVGETLSDDFPTTQGAFDSTQNGGSDVFVLRYDPVLSDPVRPQAPRNLTSTIVGEVVQLEWEPPTQTGGFHLWGYTLYKGNTSSTMVPWMDLSAASSNVTDTSVELGGTYHYAISAYSPAGEGPSSERTRVWVVIPPDPPTGLQANSMDAAVHLAWTAPTMTGGIPLMGYHIWRGTSSDDLEPLVTVDNVTEYIDIRVENARIYYYKVAAFNQLHNSSLTTTVSVTPRGPPSPPVGFEATPGNGKVSLKWGPPVSDGGRALEGFKILRGTTPTSLSVMYDLDPTDRTWVDGPLENGVTYHYAILAYNALGDGTPSPVISVAPMGPPSAPLGLMATEHEGRVDLSWYPPETDGGMTIEGYIVFRGSTEALLGPYRMLQGQATEYSDTGLQNGVTLHYAVLAFNGIDNGPLSDPVVATPRGPPGIPRALVASGGVGKVTLSWLAPERDGGSPIQGYVISRGVSPDEMKHITTIEAPVTRYEDTVVDPGVRYYYSVIAINSYGEGVPADAVSAVPFTTPTVPFSLVYEWTEGGVVLSWTAPLEDGGSPVASYRVYRGGEPTNMGYLAEIKQGTTMTDRTLVPGRTYYFAVSAVNEAGEGPRTPAIEVQPAVMIDPPGPPLGLKAEVMDGAVSLSLTWEPPMTDGGSPVLSYTVYRAAGSGNLVEIGRMGMLFSYVDYDVEEGRTYRYAVAAENAAGMGEMSRVVRVQIEPVAPAGPLTPLVILLVGVLVVISIVAGAGLRFETVRYGLVLMALPLFTRFKKDEVLDNRNRYSIHGLIIDKPGIHYAAILEELELSQGVATYHLDVLERENYVHSTRDGRMKRFYSTDVKFPSKMRKTPEEIRESIIAIVAKQPGVSQKELIRELGIDRETVGYHLRILVRDGDLRSTKKGKYTVYRLKKDAKGKKYTLDDTTSRYAE